MKNIAFAKIGKSIKLASKSLSPIGGDSEAPAVLRALANNNPDKTFYIVGRSDFKRLTERERLDLFKYDNVVDVWEKANYKLSPEDVYDAPFYQHITNWLSSNNVKIDLGVMMVGQIGTVTVPGRIEQVKNRDLKASVIDMTKHYTSPLSVWLNDSKVPYIEVVNDPRYVMNQARDMFHMPAVSLGQYDYVYDHDPIKSYEDQDRHRVYVNSKYAGMETAFCYGRSIPSLCEKKTDMLIVLNEGNPSRYNFLKEWILDHNSEVEVYGKWDDERTVTDTRFKGSEDIEVLQKKLRTAKYTFIIPIRKGWVTSKYIEMIHAGVIPFFHPTYDEQLHINVPKILRPSNPKELAESINHLQSNDNYRKALIEQLQREILKPEYYNGSFLSNTILSSGSEILGEDWIAPNLSHYQEARSLSIDDFF